jgi:predicted DNA-binding transcriptional regulator AlpA
MVAVDAIIPIYRPINTKYWTVILSRGRLWYPAPLAPSLFTEFCPMSLAVLSPQRPQIADPLLTAEDVAHRLSVSTDWVWDHSSRRAPLLPVIRIGDGVLRYRQSQIEEFVHERERLSNLRRKPR